MNGNVAPHMWRTFSYEVILNRWCCVTPPDCLPELSYLCLIPKFFILTQLHWCMYDAVLITFAFRSYLQVLYLPIYSMRVGICKNIFGFGYMFWWKAIALPRFIFSAGIPFTLNWNEIVYGFDKIDLPDRTLYRPRSCLILNSAAKMCV